MARAIALVGKRFGTFMVVSRAGKSRDRNVKWNCRCVCGEERVIAANHLRGSDRPTCGCLYRRNAPTPKAREAWIRITDRLATIAKIPVSEIRGRTRYTLPRTARHVAYRLMREEGFTLPDIGNAAMREHTTVLRSLRRKDPYTELATLLHENDMRAIRETVSRWRDEASDPTVASAETDDRTRFEVARKNLAEMPEEHRQAAWSEVCRRLWPYNWKQQAAMLPRFV